MALAPVEKTEIKQGQYTFRVDPRLLKNVQDQLVRNGIEFGTLRMIDPEELSLAVGFQRAVSQDYVKRLMLKFSPHLFGVLIVSERGGKLNIIDGQHRWYVVQSLRAQGSKIGKIPCISYATRSVKEDAYLFAQLNSERRYMLPQHMFDARLVAEDKIALTVKRAVEKYKFHLMPPDSWSVNPTENRLSCIGALERIVRKGGEERLETILRILRGSWQGDAESMHARIVRSVEYMVEHFEFSVQKMCQALRKAYDEDGTSPFDIDMRGTARWHRSRRGQGKVGRIEAVADEMMRIYEKYA